MSQNGFFIGTKSETRQELPSSEDFPRTGLIGAWRARLVWAAGWFEFNLDKAQKDVDADLGSPIEDLLSTVKDEKGALYDHVRVSRDGNRFCYYYTSKEKAEACCAIADREEPLDFTRRPALNWCLEAQLDDIFGLTDSAREKFDAVVRQYVTVMSFRSKKRRHEYQLIALPSFVAAYAQAMGLSTPGFDLSELMVPESEFIANADVQRTLIGDGDSGYQESVFWNRRQALSEALGEPDGHNWSIKDSGAKTATASDTLSKILEPSVEEWASPVYCRVVTVWDPRESATMGEGEDKTRLTIPCITQFFPSRETAKAVAENERAQTAEDTEPGTAETAKVGSLTVPAVWADQPDLWIKQVEDLIEKTGGDKVPHPVRAGKVTAMMTAGNPSYLGYDLGVNKSDGSPDVETMLAWITQVLNDSA